MLPDFPKTKATVQKAIEGRMLSIQTQLLGPLADIPTRRHFEGDRQTFYYPDGHVRESTYVDVSSKSVRMSVDELENMTIVTLMKSLDGIAEDLARQKAEMIFCGMMEGAKAAGYEPGREPISVAEYLKYLATYRLDFDEKGQPILPMIMVGPDLKDRAMQLHTEARDSPVFTQEFSRLMFRKREEWLERESSRKLVE